MTIWRTAAAIAAIVTMGMSSGVLAAPPKPAPRPTLRCAEAAPFLKSLKDQNGEIPAFNGVTIGGAGAMITVSPAGSWTMMMVAGDKLCPLAAGDLIKTEGATKPETSLPAAPALLKHGLRLIRD
jgi:hypothetical protein